MLRALFARLMRNRVSRNIRRGSNYDLSSGQADTLADEFLNSLLEEDIRDCNNKNPSVIRRDTIFIPLLNRNVEGWHCYKSSNSRVYVYMLTTGERNILF